jgi:hypothetical protein
MEFGVQGLGRRALVAIAALTCVSLPAVSRADAPRLWSVTDAQRGDHGVGADMSIAAPPSVVWDVLTDCATAPEHVPGMVSCKIIDKDLAGRWDVREHRVRLPWFPLILRNVVRSDYEPLRTLKYQKQGRDGASLRGEWQLSTDAGGKVTQVQYTGYMKGLLPVPDSMAKAYVMQGLQALKTESLRRAARMLPARPSLQDPSG